MNRELRFVFDTNVIVSALLFHDSVPGRAFAQSLRMGTILISQGLVQELVDVLSRAKFDKYLTREERELFITRLIAESHLVEVVEAITACRDPSDNQILELAVNGNAGVIVTGDRDLLVLNPFRGVPIVTPWQILEDSARLDSGDKNQPSA